jgi:hypothetical protein
VFSKVQQCVAYSLIHQHLFIVINYNKTGNLLQVPSHTEIAGNDMVDKTARSSITITQPAINLEEEIIQHDLKSLFN